MERLARRLQWKLLSGALREIRFKRNGFVWTGSSKCSITRNIFLSGHYQDQVIPKVMRWVSPSGDRIRVFVNVGANLGDVAIPMTRYAASVLAIEPNPVTFARLRKNVELNALSHRVRCVQSGIAEKTSLLPFVMTSDPGNSEVLGAGGICGFDGLDIPVQFTNIEAVRLEELVANCNIPASDVALVCSDTQGFESEVIASGTQLWRNGTPLWVEVWPRGLRCHGGVAQFVNLCQTYFTHFLPLASETEALVSVNQLGELVYGLGEQAFTDILLVRIT